MIMDNTEHTNDIFKAYCMERDEGTAVKALMTGHVGHVCHWLYH